MQPVRDKDVDEVKSPHEWKGNNANILDLSDQSETRLKTQESRYLKELFASHTGSALIWSHVGRFKKEKKKHLLCLHPVPVILWRCSFMHDVKEHQS